MFVDIYILVRLTTLRERSGLEDPEEEDSTSQDRSETGRGDDTEAALISTSNSSTERRRYRLHQVSLRLEGNTLYPENSFTSVFWCPSTAQRWWLGNRKLSDKKIGNMSILCSANCLSFSPEL